MRLLLMLFAASLTMGAAEPPRVNRATFTAIEKAFDKRLERPIESAFNVVGGTRGIYIEGVGTVVTAELNLVIGPTISPFKSEITKQEIAALRQRKIERVPYLKQIMREMLVSFASLLETMPLNENIVLGVSLLNFHWEDSTGLPTQIVMKATRQALLSARGDSAQALIKVQEY